MTPALERQSRSVADRPFPAWRCALLERTRAEIRDAILDAAEEAVVAHGFHQAKVARIAEAAGISVGTVYNHFDSKEALLLAVLRRYRERCFAALTAEFASNDPIDQLEQFVARSLELAASKGELVHACLREMDSRFDGTARPFPKCDAEEAKRHYSKLTAKLLVAAIQSGQLRSDIPVDAVSWAMQSLLLAVTVEYPGTIERPALLARGRGALRLLIQGARAPSSSR